MDWSLVIYCLVGVGLCVGGLLEARKLDRRDK